MEENEIWLGKNDPNDPLNYIYWLKSEFHNIEIKNKFSDDYIIPYMLVNVPTESMIYGNFDKEPGIYPGSGFYTRDIVLGKAVFDKEKIKKELIEDHIYRYGSAEPESSTTQVSKQPPKSEIRKIVNDLLKAKK